MAVAAWRLRRVSEGYRDVCGLAGGVGEKVKRAEPATLAADGHGRGGHFAPCQWQAWRVAGVSWPGRRASDRFCDVIALVLAVVEKVKPAEPAITARAGRGRAQHIWLMLAHNRLLHTGK